MSREKSFVDSLDEYYGKKKLVKTCSLASVVAGAYLWSTGGASAAGMFAAYAVPSLVYGYFGFPNGKESELERFGNLERLIANGGKTDDHKKSLKQLQETSPESWEEYSKKKTQQIK